MQRFTQPQRRFAYAVAMLAGYVDVTGFLQLDGYFVSFMTGNTTLLARDVAIGDPRILVPLLLIAGFVLGVILGTIVGDRAKGRRKLHVALLVLAGLALATAARALGAREISLGLLVLAMGALNTVMSANRQASPVGLTYMTGALVRAGQLIADRLGGNSSADPLPFALLWASLCLGAVIGAVAGVNMAGLALALGTCGGALLAWRAWLLVGRETAA